MQFAISGSHRAFMGTAITFMCVLTLGLIVGWRWHFQVTEARQTVMKLAAKAEAARQQHGLPVNTLVVASPGAMNPDKPSLLLADARPLRFNAKAPVVPGRSVVESLPVVNAGSVLAEATVLLDKYTKTTHWQDRVMYVYEPERVKKLMEDYYEVQHGIDPLMGAVVDQARYRIDGHEIVLITYRSTRLEGKLEVALRKGESGRLVLDWESFVGYSERSFADMMKAKSESPVLIRALVKLDDYYNYEYEDSREYISLKLNAADDDEFVNAYCKRDSILGRWLKEDLGDDPTSSLVKGYTLWVAYPPKAQSNRCLELVQVAAGRWLILPNK